MIIFYTSPGCASCRKAKRWLQDNRINFVEKNIFSNLLSESEIKYLLSRCENGTEDIISTRSKAFSSIKGSIDDLSLNELTRFIQRNPSVLKRPIMLSERSMVVGYDDDEITAMVPLDRRREELGTIQDPLASASVNLTLSDEQDDSSWDVYEKSSVQLLFSFRRNKDSGIFKEFALTILRKRTGKFSPPGIPALFIKT